MGWGEGLAEACLELAFQLGRLLRHLADQVVPIDVYIPGCPPRPEQVLDALIMLQKRVQEGRGHSQLRLAKGQ